MVKLLHEHHYEKKLFQLRKGAIAPTASYGSATVVGWGRTEARNPGWDRPSANRKIWPGL